MQRGFTKLFNTIVTSTIWQEDDKTRIVWITMLAIADAAGVVGASIPGLASVANVDVDAARAAVAKLQDVDPDSRTKDFEGRRIEPIDGGWHILNYAKYRRMLSEDERREYKAKWIAEKRRQLSTVDKSRKKSSLSTHAEAEAEAEAEEKKESANKSRRECEEIYAAYPRKVAKPEALRAIQKAISRGTSGAVLLERTKRYAATTDLEPRFIPHPATWFNQERFNDDPATWRNGQRGARQDEQKKIDPSKIDVPERFKSWAATTYPAKRGMIMKWKTWAEVPASLRSEWWREEKKKLPIEI